MITCFAIHIDAAFDGGTIFFGRSADRWCQILLVYRQQSRYSRRIFFAVMAERNAPLILCLAISRRPVVSRSKPVHGTEHEMFAARGKPVREGVCQRIFMVSLGWVDRHSVALLSIMRSSSSYTISIGRLTGRISEETGSSGKEARVSPI